MKITKIIYEIYANRVYGLADKPLSEVKEKVVEATRNRVASPTAEKLNKKQENERDNNKI